MTVKVIADFLDSSKIIGDENIDIISFSPVNNINTIEEGSIVCLDDMRYLDYVLSSKAAAIVIKEEPTEKSEKTFIIYEKPKEAFLKLLHFFFKAKTYDYGVVRMPASIDKTATISKTAFIDNYVSIGKNSKIGEHTVIEPFVKIGDNVLVGDNCHIYSNVSIHDNNIVKDRVIIGSGSVIGTDGFGYIEVEGKQVKVPQCGNVVIESDVETGANVMIDRATLGSTIIECGVKIDNAVHIAHNCKIGEHSILVAQVGIAGSSSLGHHCVLGGQVGLGDHVTLGSRVMVGAQAGIMSNAKIEDGKILFGSPTQDINREKLCMLIYRKLPEMLEAIEKNFNIKIKSPKQ